MEIVGKKVIRLPDIEEKYESVCDQTLARNETIKEIAKILIDAGLSIEVRDENNKILTSF